MTEANLSSSDLDYIVALGSSAPLAETVKKDSWIENVDGELPAYVREIARSIMKTGKTKSQAIAIAISRVKVWAAGGSKVNADTRAKAAKAVAEWERLKGKAKGKKLAKLSAVTGKMEMVLRPVEIIALSGPSYNVDKVRYAYEAKMRDVRKSGPVGSDTPYFYVKEVWNTHLIICDDYSSDNLYKVDYTVDANGNPTFGEPVKVVIEYVEAGKDVADSELAPAS